MGLRGSKNERGQVAILFALVFTFMFVLFAFVVDFGHLINNKINLQLAADAAAYAGAAWQARHLNRIAMVNYRMRQDIKEMAMRIHVTHLRHNRNFPRGSGVANGGHGVPRGLYPFICQQAHGYQAISGLRYANDTNLCRNASPETGGLPPIVVPPVIAAFDPFAVAIAAQIRRIQQAANEECRAAAQDNRVLAEHLINVYSQRSNFHRTQVNELVAWLNQLSQDDGNGDHPIAQVALESARRNLTIANGLGDFKFEILPPSGGEYIRVEENRLRSTLFYINFAVEGDGCVGRPSFIDFENVIAGVSKVPSIVTYFAVRLSAKPQMFFMPAKWVEESFPELVAMSVAKPFGSRIGPDSTQDQLLPIPNRPGNNNRILNFSFRPNDNLGMIDNKMLAYFDALHPFNGASRPDGNQNTGWPDANKGDNLRVPLQAVRSPTLYDVIFYTTFPDPNSGGDNLEQFAENLYPDYVEAAGPNNQLINTPNPVTAAFLPQGVGSRNRGEGWVQVNANRTTAGGPYAGYGEEGLSSHSLTSGSTLPLVNGKERDFGFATPAQMHSGWSSPGTNGRLGYSVKFISFDGLMRTLRVRLNSTGAMGPIENPPTGSDNLNNVLH